MGVLAAGVRILSKLARWGLMNEEMFLFVLIYKEKKPGGRPSSHPSLPAAPAT